MGRKYMDNETKWGETYFCTRSLVIAHSSALNGPQEHSELKVWRAWEDLCNCIIHKPMGLLIKVLLHTSHSSCYLECWLISQVALHSERKQGDSYYKAKTSFFHTQNSFSSPQFFQLIFNMSIQQLLQLCKKMTFLLTKQWSSYIVLAMQL